MAGQDQDPCATPEAPGKPGNVGAAWSAEEEQRLYEGFATLADIPALAARHARTSSGIRSWLAVLGLLDEAGEVVTPKPPFTPSAQSLRRAAGRGLPRLAGPARATAARPGAAGAARAGRARADGGRGAHEQAGTDRSGTGADDVPAEAALPPGEER